MELKSLLDNQNWSEVKRPDLNLTSPARSELGRLKRHYIRSVLICSLLLIFSLGIYFTDPRIEMLIPAILITSSFIFTVYQAVKQYTGYIHIDKDQELKVVINEVLKADREVNRSVRKAARIIYINSFIGGFLLGLFLSGWTFQTMLDKPLIFPVLIILTAGFYFFTKSKRFSQFYRIFNSGYGKTRKRLEEQLRLLEEN